MINVTDIPKLLHNNKCTVMRIRDFDGNEIAKFESGTPAALEKDFNDSLPYINGYGRIEIQAGTDSLKAANWRGGYVWKCFTNGTPATTNTKTTQPIGAIPAGYVSQDIMQQMIDLAVQKASFANEKKMWELEQQVKDKKHEKGLAGVFMRYEPLLMQKFLGISVPPANGLNSPGNLNGAPADTATQTQTITDQQKDLFEKAGQDLTNQVQNIDVMTTLFNALAQPGIKQAGYNKIILLLQAVNNNPAIVDTALQFLNPTNNGKA